MKLNLPHLEPIKFAQEVLERKGRFCKVLAKFPEVPSLAMIVEAAAQSSAGFAEQGKDEIDMAFLVMLKDISLIEKCRVKELTFSLQVEQEMGNITYFSFEAKDVGTTISVGTFSIAKDI